MAVVVLEPTMLAEGWPGRVGEASALLTNLNLGKALGQIQYDAIDLHGLAPISSLEGEHLEPPLVACHPKATRRITAKVTIRRGRLSLVTPTALEEAE